MSGRYLLAPQAATDLVQIWRYIRKQSSKGMADRVESVILDRIRFLAENSGAGHWRRNFNRRAGEILSRVLLPGGVST
jgi:plasmid stabilization system protein ParE